VSINVINQHDQSTLSINSVNTHYSSTVSTNIVNQQCQSTLSRSEVDVLCEAYIYISTTKSSWLYLDAPTLGRNKWRLLGPHLAQKHHGAQSTLEFQKTHQLPRLVILPW